MQSVQITVDAEYQKLLPTISHAEYEALKRSIATEGQHFPITLNPQNVILDGHSRHKICLELSLDPKSETKAFGSKLLEKKFVIESNLHRRHLNKAQKAEMALPLLEIESELAKQRMSEAGKIGVDIREGRVGSNEHPLGEGKARDIVAKASGLSPITFQRVLTVFERGSEDLKDRMRQGQISINAAYIQVQRKEKHQNTPELPQGEFDVVYADPPWKYEFSLEGDPQQHYQVMSTDEICQLQIPSAENAILFLWATNPKLEDALKVINSWGFRYKTNLVWVKDRSGNGYYFRGQHELLLVAKRGEIPVPIGQNRPSSVLHAPRQNHSEKPNEIYNLIETMYPNRKYLELFATRKREHWASWGLNVE